MFYHTHTACHLMQTITPNHRTPAGEDAYYDSHSWTTPRPLSRAIAGLVALRRAMPVIRIARPAVPALK